MYSSGIRENKKTYKQPCSRQHAQLPSDCKKYDAALKVFNVTESTSQQKPMLS